MCFDFIYKMETNDYKVSPVLYSRRNLKNNNYYRITYDEYGDTIRVKENFLMTDGVHLTKYMKLKILDFYCQKKML